MPLTSEEVTGAVVAEVIGRFDACIAQIAHCLKQLSEEQVWWRPHESMNSIGNLLLHLTGNVRQEIISAMGRDKDIRNRPAEFAERGPISKATLIAQLREVVSDACGVLSTTSAEKLLAECRIQNSDETGWSAVIGCTTHFRGHSQEIICLTRIQLGDRYRFHWNPSNAEERAT